jgi:aconitate hydratase
LARSGTADAQVYLVSPETAAASALTGVFTDPTTLGKAPKIVLPDRFTINDNCIEMPISEDLVDTVSVERGPNIKPLPQNTDLPNTLEKKVVIKLPDNITTDHIAPAGAEVLPYRSNIEKLSTFVFKNNKEHFDEVCKANNGGIIMAGENYGQGSSREHAALAPMYLGIKAVICKSFARIHKANLVNFGILPLVFEDPDDYDSISEMDDLVIENVRSLYEDPRIQVVDKTTGKSFTVVCECTKDDLDIIMAGGALNFIRKQQN